QDEKDSTLHAALSTPSDGRTHERSGVPARCSELFLGTLHGTGARWNRGHAHRRIESRRGCFHGISAAAESVSLETSCDRALPDWSALRIRIPHPHTTATAIARPRVPDARR